MFTIPPHFPLSLHILLSAGLFPLFLPQDTVNALSDFLCFFHFLFQYKIPLIERFPLGGQIDILANGLNYILAGDCYIPAIELPEDDCRPVGKRGQMHRAYLEETNPLLLNYLILTGKLHTCLAGLNEQAQDRCRLIIRQMAAAKI